MQQEVDSPEGLDILVTKVYVGGPFALHNHPCTVCREHHSVLDLSNGIMQPCWHCQERGYRVVEFNWLDKLFRRHKRRIRP